MYRGEMWAGIRQAAILAGALGFVLVDKGLRGYEPASEPVTWVDGYLMALEAAPAGFALMLLSVGVFKFGPEIVGPHTVEWRWSR